MRYALVKAALNPEHGSWDGNGVYRLGDRGFLAFVSDAPQGADLSTPKKFNLAMKNLADLIIREDLPEGNIAETFNKYMCAAAGKVSETPNCYATLSSVMKYEGNLVVYNKGDSPIYVVTDRRVDRICEDKEGQYAGYSLEEAKDELRNARKRVTVYNASDIRRIALATDGIEKQVGGGFGKKEGIEENSGMLLNGSGAHEIARDYERRFVSGKYVSDDLTLLVIDREG